MRPADKTTIALAVQILRAAVDTSRKEKVDTPAVRLALRVLLPHWPTIRSCANPRCCDIRLPSGKTRGKAPHERRFGGVSDLSRRRFCPCSSCPDRGVAQSGSAPALGAGCRRFESCLPDHIVVRAGAIPRTGFRVSSTGWGGVELPVAS